MGYNSMKTAFLSYFWLPVVLVISGCGGGGGGSKVPTPASSSLSSIAASSLPGSSSNSSTGLSSSSASSVTGTQLTIRGSVVVDRLVGGDVIFTLGSSTFAAKINDQDQYQVRLDVPAADLNKPIAAMAKGSGSNQWVELAALYPSAQVLKVLAGSDAILDATEYLGVNISTVTTTEYVLAQNYSGRIIATDEERKSALLRVSARDLLVHASYLQEFLNGDELKLPAPFNNTLEMMSDIAYINSRINILGYSNDTVWEITNDQKLTQVSPAPMVGKFLVRGAEFLYILDLNENGTGYIYTPQNPSAEVRSSDEQNKQSSLTWTRSEKEIEIKFDSPINYGKKDYYYSNECVDESDPQCVITLDSILFSLVGENDVSRFANVTLTYSLAHLDGAVEITKKNAAGFANILDRKHLPQFTIAEIQGFEWYTNNYRYVFNSDGTFSQTSLRSAIESSGNWQLDDGAIKLDRESLMILPLYTEDVGYTVVELFKPVFVGSEGLAKTLFIKPNDVTMNNTDWVGRWSEVMPEPVAASFDLYSDGSYRRGFEAKENGAWIANDGKRMSISHKGIVTFNFELLDISDNHYYFKGCLTFDNQNDVLPGCGVVRYTIDKNFAGNLVWENWVSPFFQDELLGEWRFYEGYRLSRDGYEDQYRRLAFNMLVSLSGNSILEILSSNMNSVELCEYGLDETCEDGTIHRLTRGLEIKVTNGGNGSVEYWPSVFSAPVAMVGSVLQPKLKVIRFHINPDHGYSLSAGNISGCDGVLTDDIYEIPARELDCEITVNFTPVP